MSPLLFWPRTETAPSINDFTKERSRGSLCEIFKIVKHIHMCLAAFQWISSICWQWRSESLLIKWNALLDKPSLHMAARTAAHSLHTQRTVGEGRVDKWQLPEAVISGKPNVAVGQISEAFRCICMKSPPENTQFELTTTLWFVLMTQRFTSSHILWITTTFPLLCHVSTHHLFLIITQLVILSRSHEAAIIADFFLQIADFVESFLQNMSQNYCDGGSVSLSAWKHVRYFFKNRFLGAWIWLLHSSTTDAAGGSGGRLRSLAVILTVWWCAREAVGLLLLRAAQPVNRWGRHTVSRPAEYTRKRRSSSSVLC